MSASEETSGDVVPELKPIAASVNNKTDKRGPDLKPNVDLGDATPSQRRGSASQLHLSSLFPNTFRLSRPAATQSHTGKTSVK
jgi:hypothetical protein